MNYRNYPHYRPASSRWGLFALLAVICLAIMVTAQTARADASPAEKLTALDTSLNLIPDDAAVYSGSFRGREQIEAIGRSRAWAKLREMPVVQMAWQAYLAQSAEEGTPAAGVHQALENPEVQDLLALLGDMFSNDFFFYAGDEMTDALGLFQEINAATSYGPALLQLSGQWEDANPNQLQAMLMLAVLAQNVDRVKVPGFVCGYKVEDKTRAIIHLGKLQGLLGVVLATQSPDLADCLKRTKIDGNDYLVMTLRGDMIPWDDIPVEMLAMFELEEGTVDKLVAKLKSEKLVVAVGMRDDYLLLSIGSSTELLTKLGKGTGLAERPEMAPLARFADERLLSIEYLSKEFMEVANGNRRQVRDLADFVEQVVTQLDLTEQQRDEIDKDVKELVQTLDERMPVVGAMSGVSFLSKRGIESFAYDWTTHPELDTTEPTLGLLSHVGGSPLLAVVSRLKVSVADYDLMVQWLEKGYGYFRQYGLPNMQETEREQFEKVAELAGPILKRLNQTNREKLLPSLDGQIGFVIDGRLTSKQFLTTLPATEYAMPMVEPAIVLGLRDEKLMREALLAYWAIIQESLEAMATINPEVEEWPIPEPVEMDTPAGGLFAFVPPDECPVDKQISPNVGIGKQVCVFSMSPSHTERLLEVTPLGSGGVLADPSQPMSVAVAFDWCGLLRAGAPWIDMAVDRILDENLGADAPDSQRDGIKNQVRAAIEILTVVRCVTSRSRVTDGVMEVHTLVELRDLD